MISRRSLLQAVPFLAVPLPALASVVNPLEGLQPPNIKNLKIETDSVGVTSVEFFWNSPEEPQYLMSCFHYNPGVHPRAKEVWPAHLPYPAIPQTRDAMVQHSIEQATLLREDLRIYREITGFSTMETYSRGLSLQLLDWNKEYGHWTPRMSFGQRNKSRVMTREEWVDSQKYNYSGEAGKNWGKNMIKRYDFKVRPRWDGWTLKEEADFLLLLWSLP